MISSKKYFEHKFFHKLSTELRFKKLKKIITKLAKHKTLEAVVKKIHKSR